MASKIKVDTLETANGSGTIALSNQLSGMTTASLPTLTSAEMPAGSVLQVVQATGTTAEEGSSTAYVNYTYCNATITPSSTSSKILVMFEGDTRLWENNAANAQQRQVIYRDATLVSRETDTRIYDYGASGSQLNTAAVINHLDSPSTTSAITYKLYYKKVAGDAAGFGNASITLMEIAG
jgi:hypothetical protein